MTAKYHFVVWGAMAALLSFLIPPSEPTPPRPPVPVDLGKVDSGKFGGQERYLTHLSTDKPIYRAGESVYLRGVLLHAVSRKPLAEKLQGQLEIVGPKGDVVASGEAWQAEGVLGFRWLVPDGMPGGVYRARVSYADWSGGYAPAERHFEIRAYRVPRFKTQIEFVRDGYGPGDSVSATCRIERAEGGYPAGAAVTAIARVDGREVFRETTTVDDRGQVASSFALPDRIGVGEGVLMFAVRDGGFTETAAKTIPILLQTLELNTFPEGGELVAGLPNRVYLEARTPAGKPADIAGLLLDDHDREVAQLATLHEGRGRFSFTPDADRRYRIRITKPAGIANHFNLPAVKNRGALIQTEKPVTEAGKSVLLRVGSSGDAHLEVTLARLETVVARKRVAVRRGHMERLSLPVDERGGVLTATVWSEDGRPLAERLVFCRPARELGVSLSFDQNNGVPGETIALTVKTTDGSGKPVSAVVGLTVSDDSVLEMVETREQAPRLPVMVLLENEVRDLADAHVYLDPANPSAPMQLDLLLGTQGWRRFALSDWENFLARHGDEARRVLAHRIVSLKQDRIYKKKALAEKVWDMLSGAPDQMGAAPQPMAAPPAEDDIDREAPAGKPRADQGLVEEKQEWNRAPRNRDGDEKAVLVGDDRQAGDKDFAAGRRKVLLEMAEAEQEIQNLHFREYAHDVRPDRQPGQRRDFTETLYWRAALVTDARTGEATVRFALNDAVTAFRATADAFSGDGALGAGQAVISSVQPFFLEPKPPLQVTGGDQVTLPIGIVNNTNATLAGRVRVVLGERELGVLSYTAAPRSRVRQQVTFQVDGDVGERELIVEGGGGAYHDRVTRTLRVIPRGFPVERHFGGTLSQATPLTFTLDISDHMLPGSLRASAGAYPTPLASLTEALEALIREPHGCFEQTSSTSYPLVMAQRYFTSHQGIDPQLIARARKNLEQSYTRLTGFECAQKGYEWFGGDPGHEALTAYGLMQFADMREVHRVDAAMLDRTRAWLLQRRNGEGGFQRNPRALDSFGGAPQETTDAYITWALSEAGTPGLEAEVDHLRRLGETTKDSYILALAANVMYLAGDTASGAAFLERLARRQQDDGHIQGATTTITRSGGDSLAMETTALGLLAWMREPRFAVNLDKGMGYLADRCKGGRFGSTQATVLALRAIVTYDSLHARPKTGGKITVTVDGRPVADAIVFQPDHQGTIQLPDFAGKLGPGRHHIGLAMSGGSNMPVSVTVGYHTLMPDSGERCRPRLRTRLGQTRLAEGEITEIAVVLNNPGDEVIPTPVAVIGLPGGLEPRHDRLAEMVAAGIFDAYEVVDGQVICYWRYLAAGREIRFSISAVAAVPGTYTGPASRSYAYYTDEDKHWVAGTKVIIDPS